MVFGASYVASALLYGAAAALRKTEQGRALREITPAVLSPLGVTFGAAGRLHGGSGVGRR